MASKQKALTAIKQTLKDLLYTMKTIDDEMKNKMETAIDSFVDDSVSQYSKSEISEKFSDGEKAIKFFFEYVKMKANEGNRTISFH